ncbi:MAG: PEGA domain-containing protein [Polyangiales bacterium]
MWGIDELGRRALLWALLLTTTVTFAQPSRGPTEAARLHEEGRVAYAAGDFERARERFEASLALQESPTARLSLGLTAERLGDAAEAVRSLELYLASGAVIEDAAALRARIDRLRRTPVEVRVTSSPAGALVHVDGEADARAVTPARLALTPGHHVLRLVAPGHAPRDHGIEVRLGDAPEVDATLDALPALLRVEGRGTVRIDDVVVGDAPWLGEVAPGERNVHVAGARFVVHAHRGETSSVEATPAPTSSPRSSLEGELLFAPAVQFRLTTSTRALFAPRLRITGGVRFEGRGVVGLVGLDVALASIDPGGSPSWLGTFRFRGGVELPLASKVAIRLSAGLGVAWLRRSASAAWAPTIVPAGGPPEALADHTLGSTVAFELGFSYELERVALVLTPFAIELVSVNPVAIQSLVPSLGVRFR